MAFDYKPGLQAQAGFKTNASDPQDAVTPVKPVDHPVVATISVTSAGVEVPGGTAGAPVIVQQTSMTPTAGSKLDGTVTNASGGFFLAADPTRKPGDVQGQNTSSTATIAFEEFNGTAVINTTYTVPPLQTFSITTNNRVNFISSAATSPVAITKIV